MSADFLVIGGRQYWRESELLVPALGAQDLVVVIGKTVTGPALGEVLRDLDASVEKGEQAVVVPLDVFDAAAQDRVREIGRRSLFMRGTADWPR